MIIIIIKDYYNKIFNVLNIQKFKSVSVVTNIFILNVYTLCTYIQK